MKVGARVEIFGGAAAAALRVFRIDMGWTLRELGSRIGIDAEPSEGRNTCSAEVMVSRWENAKVEISPYYRRKIEELAYQHGWPFSQYAGILMQFQAMADKVTDEEVTYRHCLLVSEFAEAVGRRMMSKLETEEVKRLSAHYAEMEPKARKRQILSMLVIAAQFHDLGKIWIANKTVSKKGPLDKPELDEMRRHPLFSGFTGTDGP